MGWYEMWEETIESENGKACTAKRKEGRIKNKNNHSEQSIVPGIFLCSICYGVKAIKGNKCKGKMRIMTAQSILFSISTLRRS